MKSKSNDLGLIIEVIRSNTSIIIYSQAKIAYLYFENYNESTGLSIKTFFLQSEFISNNIKQVFTSQDDYNGSEILIILNENLDFFMFRLKKEDFSLKFLSFFECFSKETIKKPEKIRFFLGSNKEKYYKLMLITENHYIESIINRKDYKTQIKSYEIMKNKEFHIEFIEKSIKNEEEFLFLVKEKQNNVFYLLIYSHITKTILNTIELSSIIRNLFKTSQKNENIVVNKLFQVENSVFFHVFYGKSSFLFQIQGKERRESNETKENQLDLNNNLNNSSYIQMIHNTHTLFFIIHDFIIINTLKQDLIISIDTSNTDMIHITVYDSRFKLKSKYFLVKNHEKLDFSKSKLDVFKKRSQKNDCLILIINCFECVLIYNISITMIRSQGNDYEIEIHPLLIKRLVFSCVDEFLYGLQSDYEEKVNSLVDVYKKRLYNEVEFGKRLEDVLSYLKK